jgi:PAS domain-containing protein
VRIYRSATAFIDTFDTGTLIYSGDGTSCVDDNADTTGSAVLYYTAYTVWEDNSRIVDPRIVMAWTYWGSTVEIPSFFWWPSCGELNDDDGTALVSYTFTNHVDAPTKAEAEEEIDEDDPDVSFSDIAEFSALHTIDLLWVFNGAAKWNDGYTAVYRSLSAGTGLRGTLVARTNHLWGEYTDTVADDYVTRYYTFVHYVYGVGVYTYEKTVAAKTRDLSLTAPATAYSGVAFSTVLQCLHWDGTSDTSYTPTDSLALSITGTSTAISPTSTDASGWANGAKTVSTTLTCVGTGSTTIWATGAGLVASDTLLNKIHTLTVTVPANVEAGVAFDVSIQGVGWEGGNDTSYVPAEALTLSIGNANTVSPTSVGVTGWSSGAKTVSVTITGTTYGSDTVSLVNSIGDAVMATDAAGLVTRMNPAAERLTGWSLADALGQPLSDVFRIISALTRLPAQNPVQLVMAHGEVVGLANHTTLLARDGQDAERWNLLNPTAKKSRVPFVTQSLQGSEGPIIAATDYMRTYAEQIRAFMPAGRTYKVLGTDGFGRSDTRAKLREFFEVNRYFVTIAALKSLADVGSIDASIVAKAIEKYGLDPNKPNPVTLQNAGTEVMF